jgi:hypothetical protein
LAWARPEVRVFYVRLLTLVALAACSARLPHPIYSQQPTSALVEVAFAPPPARPELIPARPRDDAVWIDGEWAWRGRRWAWRAGRWVEPPAGATFSPWTTVRRDDGVLFFAPGTWRDAKGDAIDAPKALATAGTTSSSGSALSDSSALPQHTPGGAVVAPSGVEVTDQERQP